MPTETKTTRELVEEQFDAGVEDAKAIAKKIKKEPATVYVHLRNIRNERNLPSRGRGRPPKVESGNGNKSTAPRKAPPKAGQKSNGSAGSKTTKTTAAKAAPTTEKATTNGHALASEFPQIESAIRAELKEARRRVTMLEGMLKPFES